MGIFSQIQQKWTANFTELVDCCGIRNVEHFSNKLYEAYCNNYASAGYLKNAEWMLRHYQASKKIMLSALFYKQSEYLINRNIQNIIYYTMYYSLFNAFSSNIILLPYLPINTIYQISHKKAFNDVENYFKKSNMYDEEYIQLFNNLRLTREAYSYNLPLGSRFNGNTEIIFNIDQLFNNISNKLPVIFQVSNLLSYLSYCAWNKKVGTIPDEYDKYQTECDEMFFSFIEIHDYLGKHCVMDEDDYYRQGYLLRKSDTPLPIDFFMIEKMCEDLECGWKEKRDDYCFDINTVTTYISSIMES